MASQAERITGAVAENNLKMIRLVCRERWNRKVRCESSCSLVFPDTPEFREIMRPAYRALQDKCLMRDFLKEKPQFLDPAEFYEQQKQQTGQKNGNSYKK